MLKFSYLAMLAFTVCGSFWLEIKYRVGVLNRPLRAVISIAPPAILFLCWDGFAIAEGHWYFDTKQILSLYGPFNIPFEEYLFFLIIPLAAIMTLEAVRRFKPEWKMGDEK